jgi:hypothetical protein
MKQCQRCKQSKPVDDMQSINECKACSIARLREWERNNPERLKECKRRNVLRYFSKRPQALKEAQARYYLKRKAMEAQA